MASWIDDSIKECIGFLVKETQLEKPFIGFSGIPARAADGIYYKGTNIPLLLMEIEKKGAREDLPFFAGFQGWKNFGKQVKKGGKASYTVLAKGYLRISLETGESEKVTGIEDYDPSKFFVKPLLHSIKTFHISQTAEIEGMEQTLPTPFHKNRLDGNYELASLRQKAYVSAENVIEKWHEKWSKAVPMSEAERCFIARFGADLVIAHYTGGFKSEKYPAEVGDWLKMVANTTPARIMRSLSLAYQVLVAVAPEIAKAEEVLAEMQEATKELRKQKQVQTENQPVAKVSLNF